MSSTNAKNYYCFAVFLPTVDRKTARIFCVVGRTNSGGLGKESLKQATRWESETGERTNLLYVKRTVGFGRVKLARESPRFVPREFSLSKKE